jgi:hypothetical protein
MADLDDVSNDELEAAGAVYDRLQVANTILQQLGGRRFTVMTGAHSFSGGPNSLTFKIPRNNARRIAAVRITLTPADLYDIEFLAFRGSFRAGNYRVETVATCSGVYCEDLRSLFTSETGLATSL